ncbi:MAG: cytochrome c [Rhodospirillales bacterium]
MLKALSLLLGLAVLIGTAAAVYLMVAAPEPRRIQAEPGDAVRGTYLARLGGCIACHTDSKGGGALLAGGAAIETPFGTFYGPNITQDPDDGIGDWSLQDFAAAMTGGQSPAGFAYYPVFPYTHYTLLSDQEIADLWAALKTVPGVPGRAPANRIDPPFDQRFLLIAWQTLFLDAGPFRADPERSEAWNRGAFIVEGPGHCGACHTPRNLLGGPESDQALAGGSGGPGGEKVPAITAAALQAAGWSTGDIAFALKTGITPDGDSLGGSMGEVIQQGTSWLSDEDRQAIAVYLLER